MEEDRIPKQILECKQSYKLPRGRPKQTWLEKIANIIEKRGINLKEAKKKTLDRDQWRKFVRHI